MFLCPPTSYAPGSQTALTATSTTLTALSSANVNTGSFTAPASGQHVPVPPYVLRARIADGTHRHLYHADSTVQRERKHGQLHGPRIRPACSCAPLRPTRPDRRRHSPPPLPR